MKTNPEKTRVKTLLAATARALFVCLIASSSWAGEIVSPATGITLVEIPAGCFQMGSDAEEDNEQPVHEVCLDRFYIGKHEVTQKEWKTVMGENPSQFKGDNLPVDNISWNDAREFTTKLNAMETERKYRLPTEAEWEYAARASSDQEHFWGENAADDFAWYDENSGDKTHPVGGKKPNAFGLYDMAGNLWEWVSDWYAEDYYQNSPRKNPKGPPTGEKKSIRGGSWFYDDFSMRSAFREAQYPKTKYNYFGLRIAAD
ncbi:MAG: formylglycine-generating enzyme family protein [Nitrospinales bacterium]